jgi:response regulator RpfG family c-di-GMP phosphodiesterase
MSERIATYATGIATQMGLIEEERHNVQLASLLHNIGALVVDDESFFGAGQTDFTGLGSEEKRIKATLEMIKDIDCSSSVSDAIKYMNERNDGSGPEGLKGNEIPVTARILSVAREFDARANKVTTDASPEELLRKAIIELGREGGHKFNQDVVKAMVIAHRNGLLYSQRPTVMDSDIITDPRQSAPKNTAEGIL